MTPAANGMIDFTSAAPTSGSLDVRWSHGAASRRRAHDPAIQVRRYDEHTMTTAQLRAIRAAAAAVAGQRGVHGFDDFIIYNDPGPGDLGKLMARGMTYRHSELRRLMAGAAAQKSRALVSRH